MLILAVDTSAQECSLAVLQNQVLLGQISSNSDQPYSSRLFRDLEQLLGRLSLSLNQFDLFAVAAGPGSFTGLRVGMAAVKAWAEIGGKPVAAVSGLQAVAAQAEISGATLLVPVIDARRGQIYGAIYQQDGGADVPLNLLGDEVALGAKEFLTLVTKQANGNVPVFVSPNPELIRPALLNSALAGARIETVSRVLAPAIARLGYQKALRGEVVDALNLEARYVRRSDAEVNWKGI